jgi:hypothetical protein
MTTPFMRPLAFGEILDGAFTLYRRNLALFLLTAVIPMAVLIAAFALLGGAMFAGLASGDPTAMFGAAFGGMMMLALVGGIVLVVMWAALTRNAAQSYLGQPASLGDGFRAGLRSFLPLLGAGIVITIGMIVVVFAISMVAGVTMAIGMSGMSSLAAIVVGFVVFVLAAAAYLCAIAILFAVVPAVVVEGKGPIEAIARSFDLARGALGRVIGLMLVTLLITYLPGMAVMALTGGFSQALDPSHVPSVGQFVTQQLLGMAVWVFTTPFMVAVIVLLYFDRRVRTEALDVRMAADGLYAAGS